MNAIPNEIFSLLEKSKSKFIKKLLSTQYERLNLYLLNKNFIKNVDKFGNTNKSLSNELNNGNIIYLKINFFILDEENWKIIKKFYPLEEDLNYIAEIHHKKCIIHINDSIRYFYFIYNNQFEEGYFMFPSDFEGDFIISKFLNSEISKFYQEFKIRNQKGCFSYENFEFIIRDIDDIHLNNNEIISKNNDNNKFDNKNNFNNSLNIYKCIIQYFKFRKYLFQIKSENTNKELDIFLIDKNWINNFKNKCNYTLIKNNQNNIDSNTFINNLSRNYPINESILENKPKEPEKKILDNNIYYYIDYEFIDNKTLEIFFNVFNMFNVNLFKKYKVIFLYHNDFIVIYNNKNLELVHNKGSYDERFLLILKDEKDFIKIKFSFLYSNFNSALNELGITNTIYKEQKMIYQKRYEIGTLINLSFFKTHHISNFENNIHEKNEDFKNQAFNEFEKNKKFDFFENLQKNRHKNSNHQRIKSGDIRQNNLINLKNNINLEKDLEQLNDNDNSKTKWKDKNNTLMMINNPDKDKKNSNKINKNKKNACELYENNFQNKNNNNINYDMRHKSPELNLIHNIEINERINEKNMNINNNDKRINYEQNKGNNINDDNYNYNRNNNIQYNNIQRHTSYNSFKFQNKIDKENNLHVDNNLMGNINNEEDKINFLKIKKLQVMILKEIIIN